MGRIRVGKMIGAEKFDDAKRLASFNMCIAWTIGAVLGTTLVLLRHYATMIYTTIPICEEILGSLLFVYGFVILQDVCNTTMYCLLKVVGRSRYLSVHMFLIYVVGQGCLGYVFCFVLQWKAEGLVIGFCLFTW